MNNKPDSSRRFLLIAAAALTLALIGACKTPLSTSPTDEAPAQSPTVPSEAIPIPTPTGLIPVTGGGEEPAPALLEYRLLSLEYPPVIKAGSGSDVIILTLEVDDQGNITPTAVVGGNIVEGDVIEIPNLYATHNVTARAVFQVANMEVNPSDTIAQPLKQGRPVKFIWTIRAQDVGTYEAVVQLFLNFENRETGENDEIAISAQFIKITVEDFFGFSTDFVKTSGVVGSVLGTIVGFPFFKDIVKFLFERLTEKSRKNKRKIDKPSRKK